MTIQDFKKSLTEPDPPRECTPLLQALWYEGRGDWNRAHLIAQDVPDRDGSRVHAYLHRREGDLENARYWYRRAGIAENAGPLETEWEEIAVSLLEA